MSKALSHHGLTSPPKPCSLGDGEASLPFVGSEGRRGQVAKIFFHFVSQTPGCSDRSWNCERFEVPSLVPAKKRRSGDASRARGLEEMSGMYSVLVLLPNGKKMKHEKKQRRKGYRLQNRAEKENF